MESNYYVLTLWQPWATLLVHGLKKYETRPQQTWHMREPYLIHAAQKWVQWQIDLCSTEPFKSALESIGCFRHGHIDLPRGCIIGEVTVELCNKILWVNQGEVGSKFGTDPLPLSKTEQAFGDYRQGRWVWKCINPKVLKEPIKYRGQQGYYAKFEGYVSNLKYL